MRRPLYVQIRTCWTIGSKSQSDPWGDIRATQSQRIVQDFDAIKVMKFAAS